ncbi:carbonic anhydrase 2 [Anopheles nili]|uniref:carbonic anhydrase 2 n=1 Tax=Anopheles nili TaxID=185578 RepID=UPI00237A6658|nr:carbonic anhydrase 2 [Anopheles nili]
MASTIVKHVQSPIALNQRSAVIRDGIQPLEFFGHWDGLGRAHMVNTGSSVMITFSDRPYQPFIVGGVLGNKYIFEQLHFHWGIGDGSGCEHTLEGSTYSMEAHAVHYNAKYGSFAEAADKPDGLAVLGFFVQAYGDNDCPAFDKIVTGLQYTRRPNAQSEIDADCLAWMGMQELNRLYYSYKGSLTTPPYFESVTWLVYKTPIYVSGRQLDSFRQLQACAEDPNKKIVNNFRPVQVPLREPELIFVRNNLPFRLSKL